jgi:hypothetical protein
MNASSLGIRPFLKRENFEVGVCSLTQRITRVERQHRAHKLRYSLRIVPYLQFVARGLLPHHHGDQVSIK